MVAEHFTLDGETIMNKMSDETDHTLVYVPELDCIAIDYMSLGLICRSIQDNRKVSIPATDYWGTAYCISARDGIFLGGVEEAHHAYHIKSGGAYTKYKTPEELKNDPAEIAAGKVIRQAIREKGLQLYILINGQCFPCNYPAF